MTQKALSEVLHISEAAMSTYESGDRTPGLDTICHAADYFHVPIDFLIGRSDSRLIVPSKERIYVHNYTWEDILRMVKGIPIDERENLIHHIEYLKQTRKSRRRGKKADEKE